MNSRREFITLLGGRRVAARGARAAAGKRGYLASTQSDILQSCPG